MGLFGKSNTLAALLQKLESGASMSSDELGSALEAVFLDPEFQLEKNLWLFTHPSPQVRARTAKEFAIWSSPAMVDRLLCEMAGAPPAVRKEIAGIVVRSSPQRAVAKLGAMVHSKETAEREVALDIIEEHESWQELLPYLKVTIQDPEQPLRRRTAKILSRGLDNPAIFLLLRDLIHDEDAVFRHIIIDAFARRPTADIVEPFFERLLLEGLEGRALILRALSQLARTSQAQVEDRMLPMLCDESSEIRDVAVKLLGEMPDRTRVLRAFLLHCRGLAFWLRERSIQSVLKISSNLTEPLMTLMGPGEDEDVRVGAMLIASGSKDPRLVPLIREIFLGSFDWWVRSMAAEALANFPEEAVTDLLLSKIDDSELRYSIIFVLGKRSAPAATAALLGCLDDARAGIRRAALEALSGTRTPDVLRRVALLAESDPDEAVCDKAEDVLRRFGGEGVQIADRIARKRAESPLPAAPDGELLGLAMANEALNAN